MKIKMDFISNSSSTSFIYISAKAFNENAFYMAAGVDRASPMFDFFKNLYYALKHAIQIGDEITDPAQIPNEEDYPHFTPEVIQRVREALIDGKSVICGSFSSDTDLPTGILCTEFFEINSEDFYINAYDNYW